MKKQITAMVTQKMMLWKWIQHSLKMQIVILITNFLNAIL